MTRPGDFQLLIRSGAEGINRRNDNVDVEVRFKTGEQYIATFFTLANIVAILERYATSGECKGGLYFWASNMIVVKELSEQVIRTTIEDLIDHGELEQAFSRVGG